ncbi:SMI1/KNR4 family protein [Acinetobacter sp. MD2(2019)]|uniref:SMI1/KNR4 family protein n=1 Tax=Acinetobacter sp. MD2(2019) TaxID=2605273 RepID=UPI002D1E7C61|nr:SMI1/KNR4 family protein [Acinetobacter sp. MD2(2019)]MEB3754233.1 SMI1/KNR4 family protein [Acinetobacter sp. MD2(2019)]
MNIDVSRDHGQIDRKIIENYAKSIGYKFPQSYVELLSKHNGLTPQKNYFEFLDHNNEITDRVVYFYSYGYEEIEIWDEEDRKKYEDSIKKYEAIEFNQPDEHMYEFMYKNMVIFGECAGGDQIAFDYRDNLNTDEPHITLIYHDDLIEISPTENKLRTIKLADSFISFMALLKEDNF